jgi:uncharacterized protein (TIGR00725 family)
MKTAVGVMGSSRIANPEVARKAEELGRLIAQRKAVLITGATTGLPLAAARGASSAGGEVIGFSPAIDAKEHERIGMPKEHHDLIVYTGFSFKGRNLLNVRACHGILFLGGSMGVLNEFTIAYDEGKIIGILEGSGGFCNHMRDWMQYLAKPNSEAIIHYNADPVQLLNDVFDSIEKIFGPSLRK